MKLFLKEKLWEVDSIIPLLSTNKISIILLLSFFAQTALSPAWWAMFSLGVSYLAMFCFPEIPEWLRVYSKAPPEHDHKLKVRFLISRFSDALANNNATSD